MLPFFLSILIFTASVKATLDPTETGRLLELEKKLFPAQVKLFLKGRNEWESGSLQPGDKPQYAAVLTSTQQMYSEICSLKLKQSAGPVSGTGVLSLPTPGSPYDRFTQNPNMRKLKAQLDDFERNK